MNKPTKNKLSIKSICLILISIIYLTFTAFYVYDFLHLPVAMSVLETKHGILKSMGTVNRNSLISLEISFKNENEVFYVSPHQNDKLLKKAIGQPVEVSFYSIDSKKHLTKLTTGTIKNYYSDDQTKEIRATQNSQKNKKLWCYTLLTYPLLIILLSAPYYRRILKWFKTDSEIKPSYFSEITGIMSFKPDYTDTIQYFSFLLFATILFTYMSILDANFVYIISIPLLILSIYIYTHLELHPLYISSTWISHFSFKSQVGIDRINWSDVINIELQRIPTKTPGAIMVIKVKLNNEETIMPDLTENQTLDEIYQHIKKVRISTWDFEQPGEMIQAVFKQYETYKRQAEITDRIPE